MAGAQVPGMKRRNWVRLAKTGNFAAARLDLHPLLCWCRVTGLLLGRLANSPSPDVRTGKLRAENVTLMCHLRS
jgi:hypothetical protein